jgi:predicted glycoside hydrolase/deacetylase ChbG (UPF0249 family)
MDITFHADDFGITVGESRSILECSSLAGGKGLLTSTSVFANSGLFPLCAELLDPHIGMLKVAVHINLTEGHCCATPSDIPLLVNHEGYFNQSFFQLTRLATGRDAGAFSQQLRTEIAAQIDVVVTRFPALRNNLRIDGHQHVQLIPAVFDAILDVVREGGYELEYMRIPCEPADPFLNCPSLYPTYRPINWVKHWVLNHYWHTCRQHFPDYRTKSALFCGVLLSGRMDRQRLEKILPHYVRIAHRERMDLEVLFHPCVVNSRSECLDPSADEFVNFYLSPDRLVEAETLRTLEIPRFGIQQR